MSNYINKIITSLFIVIIVIIFWYIRDINSLLAIDARFHSKYLPVSDLAKYNADYLDPAFGNLKDPGYIFITILFKNIGISFKFFLFSVIFSFYSIFLLIFNRLTLCNKWYINFLLLLGLSLWMQPLVTVALRQGIAFIFLIFFLFRKDDLSFLKKILIVFLVSSIHLSAIIFLPYILFERYFITKVKFVDILFILTFIIYSMGVTYFFSDLLVDVVIYLGIDLRAFTNNLSEYKTGFSIYKSLAIIIPLLLFRFTKFSNQNFLGRRMYIFYIYVCICGMLLSEFPYHDRVFLYAWGISPIFITCFIITLLASLTNNIYIKDKNNYFNNLKNKNQILLKNIK